MAGKETRSAILESPQTGFCQQPRQARKHILPQSIQMKIKKLDTEFGKAVLMNLFARQEYRLRLREQACEHSRGKERVE